MRECDVIIVGAGAAGLMAAMELVKKKKRVIILEARNRLGGRIETRRLPDFSESAELGAEFIHGNLPLTLKLLNHAGIEHHSVKGQMWQSKKGALHKEDQFIEDSKQFEKKLRGVKEDITIDEFFEKYFPGDRYADVRDSVRGFVEGYDAADTSRASTIALRDEWLTDDDSEQHRIDGGYGKLIEHIGYETASGDGSIYLSSIVKEISWKRGEVSVTTASGESYQAAKVLITVSLGVLQQEKSGESAIHFHPPIPEKISAATSMGFGSVIKILFQFTDRFWQDEIKKSTGHPLKKLGFIFSDAMVPTWWTQYPDESSMLTGWFAGPKSAAFNSLNDETEIFEAGMSSLTEIFKVSREFLNNKLAAHHIANWNADPFSLGGYAYATVGSTELRNVLGTPVEDTIYFAGEALYEGKETGTVEAALVSGKEAAARILKK